MNERKTAINAMVKFTGLWNFYFIILFIVVIILVEIIINALAGKIKQRIISMNIPNLVIMIKEPTLIP